IFLNGKVLIRNYSYDPPSTDLYLTSYEDGTPIGAGDSELFIVTSDSQGKDTVAKGKLTLNFNRQTVIAMGRGHIKPPMKPTALIIRLDDQTDQQNISQSLVRFVNAIPDLDSLDIYFRGDTNGIPLGTPDLTIHYGQIMRHLVLNNVIGLTITEAGHPKNVVFSIGYKFAFPGFYITAVIRGESKPVGTDFTAAPIVLSDVVPGVYLYSFKTFGIRLVNGSRFLRLSLLIKGTQDSLLRGDYPNQRNTLDDISPDTVTGYLPLTPSTNANSQFWFSNKVLPFPNHDTILRFQAPFSFTQDNRFSVIAVEKTKFGDTGRALDDMVVIDTMTNPAGNFGRVRVINLSPDHDSISITIGGKTVTTKKKDVLFFDLPIGNQTMTLKDGSAVNTQSFTVLPATPISVYIMPETTAAAKFPIATSPD
ncbi:MAG: hypothetical protein ACHQM6_03355, partial [Candidatus Kapaibacterium sp.]